MAFEDLPDTLPDVDWSQPELPAELPEPPVFQETTPEDVWEWPGDSGGEDSGPSSEDNDRDSNGPRDDGNDRDRGDKESRKRLDEISPEKIFDFGTKFLNQVLVIVREQLGDKGQTPTKTGSGRKLVELPPLDDIRVNVPTGGRRSESSEQDDALRTVRRLAEAASDE